MYVCRESIFLGGVHFGTTLHWEYLVELTYRGAVGDIMYIVAAQTYVQNQPQSVTICTCLLAALPYRAVVGDIIYIVAGCAYRYSRGSGSNLGVHTL